MKKLGFLPLFILALSTMFIFTQCKDDKDPVIDKPIVDDGSTVKLEDLTPVVEIASFDTTFTQKENDYRNCTVNWKDPYSDEAALIKISVAEQQDMLLKAKKGNGGKDVALYISSVDIWAGATAFFSAIAYEGTQTDFTQVAKGEDVAQEVVGNKFPRVKLTFKKPYKIAGLKDVFVGAFASNAASWTNPFSEISANPNFPGRTAKYPSYGVCPSLEKYLQELNDPNETERWGWANNTNWCIKVTIAKEIVY